MSEVPYTFAGRDTPIKLAELDANFQAVAGQSGSGVWGAIIGNLQDQLDLKLALDDKASAFVVASHILDNDNPHLVTKAQIGLSNVDNISDVDKPISTAQQLALDAKAPTSAGTAAGTSFTPAGSIAATTVQAALAELDAEKAPVSAATAAGTSFTPGGNIAANNVQAALTELDTEKAPLAGPSFTGAVTSAGDINLTGTGRRITGDFSNATVANRLMFQSNVGNGITAISTLPNGTGGISALQVYNNSDPSNSSFGLLQANTTEVSIGSSYRGTGAQLPVTVVVGGSEAVRINISGNTTVGISQTAQFPSNVLSLAETTHVTSKRVGLGIGVRYSMVQDTNGTGARDLFIYDGILAKPRLLFDEAGNTLHVNSFGALGYGAGAGGTVIQPTSKGTAVTLHKPCGQITMASSSIAPGAYEVFILFSSHINTGDQLLVNVDNNANYRIECMYSAPGWAGIKITNTTGSAVAEAVRINFAIFKGATS